jgi:hypothetical protein
MTLSRTAGSLAASVALALAPAIGAQQQASASRAGFPCGARLDPSYFQVAEGSGGHLLLLAPEEIAGSAELLTAFDGHPQTLFRLAGEMKPGMHEFGVPIDSSVESVVFSISGRQPLSSCDRVSQQEKGRRGDSLGWYSK